MIKNGAAGNAAAPKNAVQEIDAAPPQTVKPAACLTDLSALPAAASDHSVLLPERFSGHAAFHLRYPVSRDSPEPHPPIVLSTRRTPESFTPSVDLRHFPMGFHCRYSVVEDSRILSYAPRNVNCPRMAESLKKLRFSKEICAYGRKSGPSFGRTAFQYAADQKSALPTVRGCSSTSRMLFTPVRYITIRSKPRP